MNQHNLKLMTKPTIISLSISILFLALIVVPKLFGLFFIYDLVDSVIGAICLVSSFSWIFLIVKHKTSKKWPRIVVIVASVIILAISIPFLLLFTVFQRNVYFESVSPSGTNRLVVFESQFLDSSYSAYPRVLSIFYRYQDNGFVRKHNFWGHAEIHVDWVTDNHATVKVIIGNFTAVPGSNTDDEIIVSFD
jgi:hypothetical protein